MQRIFGAEPVITREFYEAVLEFSDYKHDAPVEDLTRSQDLNRFGWCNVCNTGFKPHGAADRVRMVQVGICGSCDHAVELWRMRDEPKVARIDGKHWVLGNVLEAQLNPNESFADLVKRIEKENYKNRGAGCGGSLSVIQFNDGRTVFTNDLWGQGDVPEMFAHLLPDNAKFVSQA